MTGPNTPYTLLSHSQVLQQAFNEEQDRLRIEGAITTDDGTPVGTSENEAGQVGLNVSVINQSLDLGIKTFRLTVTDTAAPIIATIQKLANAKVIGIRIMGEETVYIGDSSVTSSTGYPKYSYEEMVVDIKNNVDIYAICETGKTCNIAIIQLA